MNRILTSLAALLLLVQTAVCAEDTRQGIFAPTFRTLQVEADGVPLSMPVVSASDSGSSFTVSFDELAEEARYLRCSLTHCDARWQPDGLVYSEFLDGFNEFKVEDVEYSRATIVHYVHYRIHIPNEQMRITASGNYLLKVYDENEPDQTLLQARFSVCDFSADVSASVSSRTDIDSNLAHQQVSATIDTRNLSVDDPFTEIILTVTQNGRPDTERIITAPLRIEGKKLVYDHLRPLIFPAGNEYRRFETVEENVPGMNIDRIDREAPVINMYITPDRRRADETYLYDRTQAGAFRVRAAGVGDSDTEADYVLTHFTLAVPPMRDFDIFLEGDLTGRRYDPESRMVYNHASGAYEQSLLLKQGSYNYQYVAVPSGSLTGDAAVIEGNKYQTNNQYTLRAYHRPRGSRFDRLVGTATIGSGL